MVVPMFHIADYVVFATVLVICLAIGGYFWLVYRKKNTTNDYLMGGRKLGVFPVTISMVVTFVTPMGMLGNGAESFLYGGQWWFYCIGQSLGLLLAMLTFMPLLQPLKLTSSNQYLLLRYGSKVATYFGTILQLLVMLADAAFAIIVPSYLFEIVSGCPVWGSILVIGLCATIYTTVGGLRAVVWTDMFQAAVMLGGILAILIQGTISIGGIPQTWNIYKEGGMMNLSLVPHPLNRQDILSLTAWVAILWMGYFGCRQEGFQRYASLPDISKARRMFLGSIPGILLFFTLTCLTGVVAYAYFIGNGCDPYTSGYVAHGYQIVPALMSTILTFPGTQGLFIAAIFSASLSSLSSTLAALTSFIWGDLFRIRYKKVSDGRQTLITKLLVLFFGMITMGISFLCSLGGSVFELVLVASTVITVPYTTIFLLGASLPFINAANAVISCLLCFGSLLWMSVGAALYQVNPSPKSLPVHNCTSLMSFDNNAIKSDIPGYNIPQSTPSVITSAQNNNISTTTNERLGLTVIYQVSYLWWPIIGIVLSYIMSLTLSCIPVFREEEEIDDRLLFPFLRRCQRRKTHRYQVSRDHDFPSDDEYDVSNLTPMMSRKIYTANNNNTAITSQTL